MIKRFKSMFIVALLVVGLLPNTVGAAENSVTLTIDGGAPVVSVTTLEEAFSYITANKPTNEAKIVVENDGDPSTTITPRTFDGFDLTIEATDGIKPILNLAPIQFKDGSFLFKNLTINMQLQSTTNYTLNLNPTANNSSIVTLDAVDLALDGTGFSVHAIMMGGGSGSMSTFNILNDSDVLIQGYTTANTRGNAIYHESVGRTYNVNVTDSKFTADGNRSGVVAAAGTNINISNSTFDVKNSTGNGSNGGAWNVSSGSIVNFINNGSHGLSVSTLTTSDSTINSEKNKYRGIHIGSKLEVSKSTINVIENVVNVTATPGALFITGGNDNTISESIINLTGNKGSALYLNNGTLVIDEATDLTIIDNEAITNAKKGAGVYVNGGSLTLPQDAKIYNNTAEIEADDIFVNGGATITFGPAYAGKLEPCKHIIDGWYYDEAGDGNRWSAHGETKRMNVFNNLGEPVTGPLSLKAAHGLLMDVNVKKVWEDENNKFGKRPDKVIINIVGKTGEFELELNEANQWQDSLTEIPKGTYTISEVDVPKGYTSVISNDGIVDANNPDVTITNTYKEDPIKPDPDENDEDEKGAVDKSKDKLPGSGQNILYFVGVLLTLGGAGLGLRKYLSLRG